MNNARDLINFCRELFKRYCEHMKKKNLPDSYINNEKIVNFFPPSFGFPLSLECVECVDNRHDLKLSSSYEMKRPQKYTYFSSVPMKIRKCEKYIQDPMKIIHQHAKKETQQ